MLVRCHSCWRLASFIAVVALLALMPGWATFAAESVTIGDLVFINKALVGVGRDAGDR